ncbi:hypothetical protein [Armatimonas sp.]|uniref:hypothetical protein n=1 Tax=Armatimonas sp. TaxID=1872638 RepID=UPI003752E937
MIPLPLTISVPIPAFVVRLPLQKADQLISADFYDTPLRSALETLFKSAGIRNYVIDNGVSGTVALKVTPLPFEKVLQLMQRASTKPFTYTTNNGVWIVKPTVDTSKPPPLVTPTAPFNHNQTASYEKILLRHRTPQELAGLLGGIITLPFTPKPGPTPVLSSDGKRFITPLPNLRSLRPPGIDNIIAVGEGTLLVQGDAADIEELRNLIRQLDVPIPSVECRAEVVSVSGGKQNRNTLLASLGTGKSGTEIKAVSKFSGTPAQTSRLDVTIKATPLGDNYFEVETRWEASVPLQGAQKGQLVRLEKTFSNTRRIKAGDTMMFGGVIVKEEQGAVHGGQEVLFFLTLKPF